VDGQIKSLRDNQLIELYKKIINELSSIEQKERLFLDEKDKNYSSVMDLLNNLLIIYPNKNSSEYSDLYTRIMNLSKRGFFEGEARDLKADLIRMTSDQDPAVYWFTKAMDLFDRNEFKKGIGYLRKATEKDRNYTEAWYFKGLALTGRDNLIS